MTPPASAPTELPASSSGPALFARYAYPPNRRGSCGPADSQGFFANAMADPAGQELRAMAREFAGAWPYLQLIADATGLDDPLDRRVVQAYWIGSPRLDGIGVRAIGDSMEERFRFRSGPFFSNLSEGVLAGGVPHHSFHVFCIYPWIGLLGDERRAEQALTVLDMCRIRWGRVVTVTGDQAVVESSHLQWDGARLTLGPPTVETVQRSTDGVGLAPEIHDGDQVTMHWDWVCDKVDDQHLAWLEQYTRRHLSIVNEHRAANPAPLLG
ncbi:MAG: hypothetical protein J2P22_01145 [Nocardioides sp.]|nr:hypothetical protein [Nocardioides sp.]